MHVCRQMLPAALRPTSIALRKAVSTVTSRVAAIAPAFTRSIVTLKVDNPYSGTDYAQFQQLTKADETLSYINDAANTFDGWRHTSLQTRIDLVNRWMKVFGDAKESIARDVTGQMGKPLKQARGEVDTALARAKVMTELAPQALADVSVPSSPEFLKKIIREPIGVVLSLVPWNYPLLCAVNSVIPAVLAGNSVLIKHSDRTPLCAEHFSQTFLAAGAPPGLVASLPCDHPTIAEVIQHPDIAYVSFTGSVKGGQKVYKSVSNRFIDVGLELGGKDPAYVAADADVDKAVAGLVDGAMYNAGQSCCAVERVYVHASLYDSFVEKSLALIKQDYVLGDPFSENVTMGPIAMPKHPKYLQKQVKSAVQQGARLLTGGKPTTDAAGKGRFFLPTLLADCNHDMAIMQEENFGPILAIQKVENDEEAIEKMNDSAYGLTASVFTTDQQRAEHIARQLDTGTVFMNRCDFLDPALPWSGRKDSGKGIGMSQLGYGPLTRTKAINFRIK